MPTYQAPIRDYQFVIQEFLAPYRDPAVPGMGDLSEELVTPILEESARFCEEVLFPLNMVGDREGLKLKDGNVTLPTGFVEAYRTYAQSGWTGLTADPAYGGQGLPEFLNMACVEMICSANLSFGLIPGLSHGAASAIYQHASEALKAAYLPKMVEGVWSGVMCLTEPQAGTDLGLIRATATPNGDGTYAVSGTKIFISCGDQDATENILHLVLARLPDAPPGIKGISLFLCPKYPVQPDGSLGPRNHFTCASLEEKMGIHASPTCVMNYDGALGYLVGVPHRGMKAMFTMMNAARLYVGVQGLGLAEIAYQQARAYAMERLQGRSLKGAKSPEKVADNLLVHPDVRRMLLTIKSFTEGARALVGYTALQAELAHSHPDSATRQDADDFVQLITPVVKSYLTDLGFESTVLAQQVFGGYGYIREYGVEQYVRDARIAQIYEGTNGVQSLDLVGRKLPMHTGRYLRQVFFPIEAFLHQHQANPAMQEFTKPLGVHVEYLRKATLWMAQNGLADPENAAAGSVEYLRLFGIVYMGYIWAQMAAIALQKLSEGTAEVDFYQAKLATARFTMQKILPQSVGLLATLTAGAKPVMAMQDGGW
jgi:alkylation response protein AidB-like acyl-CoA dehydrogenase